MRIPIAMTTFNGAKYLQEQLDSFLQQTRKPDEIVVCDDGSTDATVKILQRFRQQAPFDVRIYLNESNLGYTKNFEKALLLCKGDLIFIESLTRLPLAQKAGNILLKINRIIDANQNRSLLMQLGWLRKKQLIFKMIIKGQYRQFAGFKSIAKDILR